MLVSGREDSIRIIGYSTEYAGDFARLNYQWIEHYFRIEEEDRAALDHPEAYAIAPGGEIFFVLQGDLPDGGADMGNLHCCRRSKSTSQGNLPVST